MVDERPITELLKKVESGERDAADVIVQHFWEVARRHAERHLSARARRLKGGSDIANAVLIIDDDAEVGNTIGELLRRRGHTVTAVTKTTMLSKG